MRVLAAIDPVGIGTGTGCGAVVAYSLAAAGTACAVDMAPGCGTALVTDVPASVVLGNCCTVVTDVAVGRTGVSGDRGSAAGTAGVNSVAVTA